MKNNLKYFILTCFLLNQTWLFADNADTIRPIKRHHFAFEIGLQSRMYFGDNYIHPYFDTTIEREIRLSNPDFYGFHYKNNFSWHLGLLYYFNLTHWLKLNSGIELINRRTYLWTQPDTALKYQTDNHFDRSIYNDMTFEIPLLLEFSYKRFNLDIGGTFSTFIISHNTIYRISGSKDVFRWHWDRDVFHPTIRISYDFALKKYLFLRLYLGADYSSNAGMNTSAKVFDFRIGTAIIY